MREIEWLRDQGLIEPSISPWRSFPVIVTKDDGSIRVTIDYRQLNDATEKDAMPIPRIDELVDRIHGCKFLSSIDLRHGYFNIGLDPESRPCTAFTDGKDLWQWTVMPQGLCNAPATFQRTMQRVLKDHSSYCLIYLDDILVFSKSRKEHRAHVKAIVQTLREHKFNLNVKKCHFFQRSLKYLGHIVSGSAVAIAPDRLSDVLQYPTLSTVNKQ